MKITIPLRGSDFEEDYSSYKLFIKEIVLHSNNQSLINLIDDDAIPEQNERPRIEKLNFEIYEGNHYYENEPEFATALKDKHDFFKTQFIHEYLIINLVPKENEISIDEFTIWSINRFLTRLNFLINLTYSTNVDFMYGVAYSNDNTFIGKTDIILSSNMYCYEHSRKMGWPKIRNNTLTETIEWFEKYGIHSDHRSKNNLHRAINAFSRLFGNLNKKDSADLFWIMLGIESLLVKGNQNITSQFKEKSILILGEPKDYKRKLNKLYEYRSKLIHGGFDIFPRQFTDYQNFEAEYGDYVSFALSILIALIRELIHRQKTTFEFELKLIE